MTPIETKQIAHSGWTITAYRYEGRWGWIGVVRRDSDGLQFSPGDGTFETADDAMARGEAFVDTWSEAESERAAYFAGRK